MRSQHPSIAAGLQENVISCHHYSRSRPWECGYGVAGCGDELISGDFRLVLSDVMTGAPPSISLFISVTKCVIDEADRLQHITLRLLTTPNL